jgi:hypothetical protein
MAARSGVKDDFDDDFDLTSSGAESDEAPEPVREQRLEWLKPHMLKADKGFLELVALGPGTEYSDVTIEVVVPGNATHFRIGLKTYSPEYEALAKKYGKKKADWHGKLKYKLKEHKGNPKGFIAVRPA